MKRANGATAVAGARHLDVARHLRHVHVMRLLLFFLLFFLAVCGGAMAEGELRPGESRCIIANHTGQDIYALFTAPGGSGKWSPDLLDGRVLRQGESVPLVMPYRGIWWDLRVEIGTGESMQWKNLPLRRVRGVNLTRNAGQPGAETF